MKTEIFFKTRLDRPKSPGRAGRPPLNSAVLVEALRNLDYVYWADNPKKDRMFFVKGMPPFGSKRSHHVHVTEPDGDVAAVGVQGPFARSSRGS
jgi:hypothetical protein